MPDRPHHRPMTPGDAFFAQIDAGADPAVLREAGDLAATLLVRGARGSHDPSLVERVLHLAETEGLETVAEVWAGAPADTLAGCLWRLFVLRQWVHAEPVRASREFEAGTSRAPLAQVVAGVAHPPGADELRTMTDEVLRGVAGGDFAVTLLRAAAFARIVATGRAVLGEGTPQETARMLTMSEQLETAGHLEMRHALS